jgi:hypothetical protein
MTRAMSRNGAVAAGDEAWARRILWNIDRIYLKSRES